MIVLSDYYEQCTNSCTTKRTGLGCRRLGSSLHLGGVGRSCILPGDSTVPGKFQGMFEIIYGRVTIAAPFCEAMWMPEEWQWGKIFI